MNGGTEWIVRRENEERREGGYKGSSGVQTAKGDEDFCWVRFAVKKQR
jgi:hypothetical protein